MEDYVKRVVPVGLSEEEIKKRAEKERRKKTFGFLGKDEKIEGVSEISWPMYEAVTSYYTTEGFFKKRDVIKSTPPYAIDGYTQELVKMRWKPVKGEVKNPIPYRVEEDEAKNTLKDSLKSLDYYAEMLEKQQEEMIKEMERRELERRERLKKELELIQREMDLAWKTGDEKYLEQLKKERDKIIRDLKTKPVVYTKDMKKMGKNQKSSLLYSIGLGREKIDAYNIADTRVTPFYIQGIVIKYITDDTERYYLISPYQSPTKYLYDRNVKEIIEKNLEPL